MGTHQISAKSKSDVEHLETWCTLLRCRGLRVTSTRRQLVMLILTSPDPVTANGLFKQAGAKSLRLGLATIYRALETLEQLGLMRRMHDSRGCHSYVPADNQSLLAICQACGQIDALEDKQFLQLLDVLPTRRGYQVNEISVQVIGLCASCR